MTKENKDTSIIFRPEISRRGSLPEISKCQKLKIEKTKITLLYLIYFYLNILIFLNILLDILMYQQLRL